MENKKPENPSAFPFEETGYKIIHKGMTLRDHFAGLTMQAIISNSDTMREITKAWVRIDASERLDFESSIAKLSFEYSDAMLKQREL